MKNRLAKRLLAVALAGVMAAGCMSTGLASARVAEDEASEESSTTLRQAFETVTGLHNTATRGTDGENYGPSSLWDAGGDGSGSMDDPEAAGACVGWAEEDVTAEDFTALSETGLWQAGSCYADEDDLFYAEKSGSFSLKYQADFYAYGDFEAGSVEFTADASLGTYGGDGIVPADIGVPYGVPGEYEESPSTPFNYYYADGDGEALGGDGGSGCAEGADTLVVWNYREIPEGSYASFQVLYTGEAPESGEWELETAFAVTDEDGGSETLEGAVLTGTFVPEEAGEAEVTQADDEADAADSPKEAEARETEDGLLAEETDDACEEESGVSAGREDFMDDPGMAGALVERESSEEADGIRALSVTAGSGLWWIDDYYVNESDLYYVEKTNDFSLKYQVEFHASEDLAAGSVEIVIDASLGTYRSGNNIIPTELGIPYGTPDSYTQSTASPFNYCYIDGDGNILAESQAKTASGVRLVIWNYKDIDSGTNAMLQVLYKGLDVMQIYDMTEWSLEVTATVDGYAGGGSLNESVSGNTLSGLIDTAATLSSVTKKAYSSSSTSYTPELYTVSQVNSYINGSLGEPYVNNFDDYIYIVWYVTFNGSANQAYTISVSDSTSGDTTGAGNIVGYKVLTGTSYTSSGLSYSYGTDGEGNPTLSFTSSTQESFKAAFYVVTAYDADAYELDTHLENDVTVTVHPVDGHDADTTKSASAETTWGEYVWHYSGDTIGVSKETGTSWKTPVSSYKTDTDYAHEELYELNSATGKDTGEYNFIAKSTDRGFALTHTYTEGEATDSTTGEWIEGSYYTTTTVDDALYAYPNGGTSPSQMLTKDDYYFSSVSVTVTDNGYDIWEDATAGAADYEGVDQDVYVYAMFYDADEEAADAEGWEYVGKTAFSASGTMKYTFSSSELARQPYRVKVVHSTADYATYCTISLGVMLRAGSPVLQGFIDEYGDSLDSIKIENLSGVAGQAYGVSGYADGQYYQSTSTSGGNYSETDTVTGETLAEWTESLYGTILMRDNAYATLKSIEETASASKSVTTENDVANARVLATYYVTAYEAYRVTGSSTVDALKEAGLSLPARNDVSFYDLLPYGVKYNANASVTAGRITSMNSSGSWRTNSGAWSTSGVTVTITDDDVIDNWNGTGRTMVVFHLHYDGDDASAYYGSEELWYEGYGVKFGAYYDWADTDVVDAEYNIAAYIAENVETEDQQLLGSKGSQVYRDDGSAGLSSQYSPLLVEDLNNDGVTGLYTNMYASVSTNTSVTTASSDFIKKQVKADDDAVAEFGTTAVVGYGRGYTYEVSLTNSSGSTLSDIVLFDRLENSVEDSRVDVENEQNAKSVYKGLSDDEINNHWTGAFTGVTLTALDDAGIAPVVYYSEDREAGISSEDGSATPSDVLTEDNGWYEASAYETAHEGDVSGVKAVAIDISKTKSGGGFELGSMESLSYQIHMTAPEDVEEGYIYAFNNPSYYSVSTPINGGAPTSATDMGDTVRVELGEAGTLEVEKELADGYYVPDSMLKSKFTFTLTRYGEPLANQEYMLYNKSGDGWVSTGTVMATDINGRFTLQAGQKAVFSKLVNLADIEVTEAESPLWEITDSARTDASDTEAGYCFENKYRSPVYLYKTALTTDLASEEELEEAEFTFLIEVDASGNGDYGPYANSEVLYVSEALTDGSSPAVLGSTTTDGDGYVTIGLGDVIAFFPEDADGNTVGVSYRITEVDTGESWVCENNSVTGVTSDYGTKETITNYYKYRALIITKDLSDYDHDVSECYDEWTFKITDADGEAVTGNSWYMVDAGGSPVYVLDENGEPTDEMACGTLDGNGELAFTGAGSNCRIVVTGLVMGEKYTVTETGYDETLYEQVNGGSVTAAMPTYSITKSATITNRYLLRDLSVEKTALSKSADDTGTHEFTFTLKDGEGNALADAPYTIEGSDEALYTDGNGQFTLTGGQTALFDDIGYEGDVFVVSETADGSYPQIYPAGGEDGSATLTNSGGEIRFINGDFENVMSITKTLEGLDDAGEAFADIVKADNTGIVLAGEDGDAAYAVDVTFGVYEGDACVTEDAGALIDYTDSNGGYPYAHIKTMASFEPTIKSSYPYVYIKITASGDVTLKSYNGGLITESLAPYDYIYIAEIGGCTVKASEDSAMERVILGVAEDVKASTGTGEILSEGSVMSGSAAADGKIVLVNDISSAYKASEVYKLMSEDSDEVPTGSEITFRVERYDGASETWSPASGVKYIAMDGYEGGYGTAGCVPASGVQETGSDGKITLAKGDNGYPYIRFTEDEVYVNVCTGMEDGTLRIVEVSSGTDDEWGWVSGYDGEGWVNGPALNVTYGDTFVDANDDGLVFEVEKEMADGGSDGTEFTFTLVHVTSASASPITTLDEVNDSEAGAGVYYIVCDAETGRQVSEGYTDGNGCFTLKAGQYAKFFVPEGTAWYAYEGVAPGYTLTGVEANSDEADNASVVDEINGMVQDETEAYVTHTIVLTLTDDDTGKPVEGATFTLYKDSAVYEEGLTTDENGQITVKGLTEGEYYFEQTEAPSGYDLPSNTTSAAVEIPWNADRTATYEVSMTDPVEEYYNVKYAVSVWGIQQDVDEYGNTLGLTFGPATGKSYVHSYVSRKTVIESGGTHNSEYCIHNMSWSKIIEQSQADPTVFQDCLENGCTKAVYLNLNDTLLGTSYEGQMDGDGANYLYYSINSEYRRWNGTSSSYTNSGGWPASKIRANLNGADEYTSSDADKAGTKYVLDEDTCLLSCFPEELQDGIVAKAVKSDTVYNDQTETNNTTTFDKLWLFSGKEVYGSGSNDDVIRTYEGELYQRSEAMGITTSNFIKLMGYLEDGASRTNWWLRSPYGGSSNSVYLVDGSLGYWSYNSACVTYAVAPGFCLR